MAQNKYTDEPSTIESAKALGIQTFGGKDFRTTKQILKGAGVETLKAKEPSLGFKTKWAIEEGAPKAAENVKGFLGWIGTQAKVVGGKVKEGLHEYSIKKQAEVAAREAAEKAAVPKVQAPVAETENVPCGTPEVEPAEIEEVEEPPVQVIHKQRVKRTYSVHKEGDLVTLPKEDLNKLLLEAVKHGKLHKGNVKVSFKEKALKPPKLKPFAWLSKP